MLFGKKKSAPGGPVTVTPDSLRDERIRFKIIVDSIEDGVIMIDNQQVIQLCNPAAGKICGWEGEEAVGLSAKSVMQLVNEKGEPYNDIDNPFVKIFSSTQPLRDDGANIVTRAKKQIPVSLSLSPLVDKAGNVTAAVAIFRDVTNERAEGKARADFISTASHEMRTPVAAIEGYLSLALNDKVATIDNRARDFLDKAHASTQHLGKLFQDLLTSSKAEDGRLTSHPAVIELGSYLEQLTTDLKFSAEKKGLFMEFVVGSSTTINATQEAATAGGGDKMVRPLYYVYADPDRLREVITNLFDNAVKYTPDGKITLGLTGDDSVAQCYVRDTGPGIPAEDLPHLFQKFYRVDNSATRTIGGTGLGLFICRKIIELYSGRIWVESEVGKGSSFYINLPRLSTQKATELQSTAAKQPVELAPINSLASS